MTLRDIADFRILPPRAARFDGSAGTTRPELRGWMPLSSGREPSCLNRFLQTRKWHQSRGDRPPLAQILPVLIRGSRSSTMARGAPCHETALASGEARAPTPQPSREWKTENRREVAGRSTQPHLRGAGGQARPRPDADGSAPRSQMRDSEDVRTASSVLRPVALRQVRRPGTIRPLTPRPGLRQDFCLTWKSIRERAGSSPIRNPVLEAEGDIEHDSIRSSIDRESDCRVTARDGTQSCGRRGLLRSRKR